MPDTIRPISEGQKGKANQRSEVRSQKSCRRETRDEKSAYEKRTGILNHAAEHSANLLGQRSQFCVALNGDVLAVFCKIQRRIGLAVLTVTVGQLAYKVSLISLLLPVDVIAKLGMETFDVKTKHAVHAQLAQFSRISGSEGRFFFFGEIVFPHYGFEIR